MTLRRAAKHLGVVIDHGHDVRLHVMGPEEAENAALDAVPAHGLGQGRVVDPQLDDVDLVRDIFLHRLAALLDVVIQIGACVRPSSTL